MTPKIIKEYDVDLKNIYNMNEFKFVIRLNLKVCVIINVQI